MPSHDERVLIFAPVGQDAALIARFLRRAEIHALACSDLDATLSTMQEGAGAVILAEEALDRTASQRLSEFIAAQPSWSDFPIVLLTRAGRSPFAQFRDALGNVLLLERPLSPESLVSTVQGMLRSRRRQYQVRDVLAQKAQAERALRDSEQQFRDLANSIPQLAWIARPDGSIYWYNDRWFEYTGGTFEEMQGWGWQSVHDPAVLPKVMERWRSSIAHGQAFEMTFPLLGADRKFRPFLTLIKPVKASSGDVVRWFGTATDMSSQKRAEEALIRTEKLAAAGRLAASISHEINNPLEAVTNLLYILNTSPELPDSLREFLHTAQAELHRVSHITTHTLRFYRDSTRAAPMRISEVIDSVVSLYSARLTQSDITVRKRYRDGDYVGFSGELRQVLANLIGNAVDAMPPGGVLHLRVHPHNGGYRIVVADTGHGIPPETRKHIFEPFFTTKEATGTGLGLFVSKEIIEKAGGTLRLRSCTARRNSGTVFTITLPAISKQAA